MILKDTCRICSAPGEPGQPLFYPCKCSGTIRYIHQDCLTTWLSHSKKKTCDVCKHPYSFTKVYASDMPASLPPPLLIRRLAQQTFFASLFGIRAIVIAIIWLGLLPWITIWTWRVYFTMGESTAWWISGRERPADVPIIGFVQTLTASNESISSFNNATILHRFTSRAFWQALSSDIFAGQIIASLIVLIFVAVFLLREWISQNARPGVFDEDEMAGIPPQDPPVLNQQPANQPVQDVNAHMLVPQRQGPLEMDVEARRQARLWRPHRPIPPNPRFEALPRHFDDQERLELRRDPIRQPHILIEPIGIPPLPAVLPPENYDAPPVDTDKGKEKEDITAESVPAASDVRRRMRRRIDNGNDNEILSISSSPTSSDLSFTHLPLSKSSLAADDSLGSSGLHHTTSLEHLATETPEEPTDSSSVPDKNMDRKKRARDEMEEEYEHYFRDHQPPTIGPIDAARARTDILEVAPWLEHERNGEELPPREAAFDDDDDSEDDEAPERIFWDADADREDDDDDDEDVVDIGDFNVPNRPGAQAPAPAQPQPQAPAEQMNDGMDDLEAAVEDDMEGALEAIGLRGPIFGVVQNVILMIFVLDTAIGFGIWLPFTLGKTAALLSLDPQRALYILHLPIRGMRIVTDPIVDFITLALGHYIFPSFYQTSRFFLSSALGLITFFAEALVPPSVASSQSHDITSWLGTELSAVASLWLQQSLPQEPPSPLTQKINDFFETNSTVAQILEPRFAYVGREVRLFTNHFQQSWIRLTLGHGSNERAFAVVLGYGVVGIILALYLNVFTVGNARTAGRAVRNAIRQQLLVVKVAMFIIIELIIFPLGCGTMLDACTIWVFPEASLESRIAFFTQAPLTAMFYHWVAGTMFMYQFAVLLGGCRNIMRPGAMWFIKDPQDQNFHPIRDILERPTFTQFRKLLISAFMYAMVVACGVGSLAILLFIGNRSIFPIRWKTREPLSEVPIDLLFLQIVLPYTMRHLRPRKAVYRVAVQVWRFLAARLRLTSYMFGDRHREEEVSRVYKTWVAFIRRSAKDNEEMTTTKDGTFRRVPSSDNISLPRDMRATAEVQEDGSPLNDKAAALITLQNAEAVKAKRDVKNDYIVVYFPSRFRVRIITFVMAVWTIMAIVAAICIAVPVQVGRHFFTLLSSTTVHDGYSFLAGFYILWGCCLVAKAAESMDRRRQRVTGDGPRADFAVYFAKQSLLWASKMAYMTVCFGVLIPILLGLVVDLYIVLPVRLTLHPTMVPTIRLVDMWSLGLVYCKIAIRLRRKLQLPRRQYDALHMLLSNGWTHPDLRHATKELILPALATLLTTLLVPAGAVYVVRELLQMPLGKKFLFVHVYPGLFAMVGLSRMVVSAMTVLSSWSQAIRDNEFLVEMRLQNLEPELATDEKKTEALRAGIVRMGRAMAGER
ncbi:hypothetical protein EV363DRAFT_1151445 [Boletus edulis]|nr:hypothetical protein EV363DRAFT_1151445 [Boletus edulis]